MMIEIAKRPQFEVGEDLLQTVRPPSPQMRMGMMTLR
jgi:hypothetical protein